MNNYYEVIGSLDDKIDILYGSFVRADCTDEIDAEKASWKSEGYKKIKIVSRAVEEAPDLEVYVEDVVTKQSLFMQQAPAFNFELNADELLDHALDVGFVTAIGGMEGCYLINREYGK
jgi:hypothetical protein